MINIEREYTEKHGINEQIAILEEYNAIVEELRRDLHLCKVEQNNLRSELAILRNENQDIESIKESFRQVHLEECGNRDIFQKELANLQERIALLQAEKESVVQLWQVSLSTIDILEEELKATRVDGKSTKFYQEQANTVKETYSEAIRELEGKLLQAKENVLRQQAFCQCSKQKIETLTKERDEITERLSNFEKEAREKDRDSQLKIETLQKELSYARNELDKLMQQKLDLERKLNDTKRYAETVMEKDRETKQKMAEAIDLIESAVREKEVVLHREALMVEEKARLEVRLAVIANEYDAKIEELSKKMREEHDKSTTQYISEIAQLKMELGEKNAFLSKTEKELKFVEEELAKTRNNSEQTAQKLQTKIQEYEQKLQHLAHEEVRTNGKHESEVMQLMQKIAGLEDRLNKSNEKIIRLELQNSSNVQDRANTVDERSKNLIEQYASLESQLAKTLSNKEELSAQLKSLKQDFDQEMHKRDNERHSLECKVHELEINLQKAKYKNESATREAFSHEPYASLKDTKNTFDITVENKCHCCQTVLSDQIARLQEKFERRNKELIHHVQVHQKLSKRWRDEAKSLTTKFQGKTKELKAKINALRKENNELTTELSTCKQQLVQHNIQDIQKYSATR